jgi:hypothetical protein
LECAVALPRGTVTGEEMISWRDWLKCAVTLPRGSVTGEKVIPYGVFKFASTGSHRLYIIGPVKATL